MRPRSLLGNPLAWLVVCGLGIQLCMLWWDRISLDDAIVSPRSASVIRILFSPAERLLGAIPVDGPGTRERVKILNLLRGFVPAFVLYAAACLLALRFVPDSGPALKIIVGFSALFRLTLAPYPAILETDIHRYLWDGAVGASRVNPYKYAPVEVRNLGLAGQRELYTPEELSELDRLDALRKSATLKEHFLRINHPKIPTIYPPLAQVLFSVAYRIGPGSAAVLKLLVALADLAIVGMLVLILGRLGLDRRQVVVYGWCPLVLKEYANSGHYDPLATLMVLMALYLLLADPPDSARGAPAGPDRSFRWRALGRLLFPRTRWFLASLALGLGALSKLFPVVVVLVLARRIGVAGLTVFALTFGALYAPHLTIGASAFDGLKAYARDWEFNSSIFTVTENLVLSRLPGERQIKLPRVPQEGWGPLPATVTVDAFFVTKVALGLVGFGLVLALAWTCPAGGTPMVGHVMIALAALVLMSPVSDPWYYCWIMPFVTIFPAPSWIYLSGSMVGSYLFFWNHAYPAGMRLAEYIPFYGMLSVELARRIAARRAPPGPAAGPPPPDETSPRDRRVVPGENDR